MDYQLRTDPEGITERFLMLGFYVKTSEVMTLIWAWGQGAGNYVQGPTISTAIARMQRLGQRKRLYVTRDEWKRLRVLTILPTGT